MALPWEVDTKYWKYLDMEIYKDIVLYRIKIKIENIKIRSLVSSLLSSKTMIHILVCMHFGFWTLLPLVLQFCWLQLESENPKQKI